MEEKLGIKVRIVPEDNGPTREGWLKSGRVDFSSTTVQDIANVFEAQFGYASKDAGAYPVRVAWINAPNPQAFIVRGDSPIKTIYDIKPGARIAYFAVPSATQAMDGILAWAKVAKKDIKVVEFGSFATMVKSVMEGKADVAFAALASPVIVEVASGPQGVRILETNSEKDPEGAARFLNIRTTATFGPAKEGIKEGLGKWVWYASNYYEARQDTSVDLVYNFAKWMGDNYNAYKDKHPSLLTIGLDDFVQLVDFAFLPLHEGTIKYLKEKGKWTTRHEARQKYNVELATKYVEAYKSAISRAEAAGVKVDPDNKAWVELWTNSKKELKLPRIKAYLEVPK